MFLSLNFEFSNYGKELGDYLTMKDTHLFNICIIAVLLSYFQKDDFKVFVLLWGDDSNRVITENNRGHLDNIYNTYPHQLKLVSSWRCQRQDWCRSELSFRLGHYFKVILEDLY